MNEFVELMQKIEGTGTFSVSGKLDPVFPGIVVKNVGDISLPLIDSQAEKIIAQCEQAPFGRGEETLIDTTVRNVWQISPEALEITNPQWDTVIANACKEIAKQLGLLDSQIDFELYKILVYTKGSFFQEHRDTEKIPNMFATMVVNLPSMHEGGELIVKQGSETSCYSFAGKAKFYPEFAAFYADCYHEVKPIISGYRFSLIYNLAIANRKNQPLLSQQTEINEQVDAYIQKWQEKQAACFTASTSGDLNPLLSEKVELNSITLDEYRRMIQGQNENPLFVYLLDHSYSEQNLAIANLKNNDLAKTSVLFRSAEKNHCKIFLSLVSSIEESYGDCWNGQYEEHGILRQEVFAHNFITPAGEKLTIQRLALEEDQILAKIPLRKGSGKEVSISEATGNEGARKELWYHRGAVILWSETQDIDVALKTDIDYAIHYLKKTIQQGLSKEEDRKKTILLAHHVIDHLSFREPNEILESLILLGDIDSLKKLIQRKLQQSLLSINSKILVRIFDQFSWTAFKEVIHKVLNQYKEKHSVIRILPWICGLLLEKPSPSDSYPLITAWFQEIWKQATASESNTQNSLSCLFQILSILGNQQLSHEVLLSLETYQKPLWLSSVYAPELLNAIRSAKAETHHFSILKTIAETFLERAQEFYPLAPQTPSNFSKTGHISCTCTFCNQINQWLPDPQVSSINFENTLQRNLLHIEVKITEHNLDLQIQISRQSSKFKGVVIKTNKSYEEALQRFVKVEQTKKEVESWIIGHYKEETQ